MNCSKPYISSGGSRISRRGGVDLVRGAVDPRGGYVSKILHVKTKESGPVGGGAPPPRSANDICYYFSTKFSKLTGWSPRDTPGGIKLDDVSKLCFILGVSHGSLFTFIYLSWQLILLQELKEIESKIFVDSEPEFGIPEVGIIHVTVAADLSLYLIYVAPLHRFMTIKNTLQYSLVQGLSVSFLYEEGPPSPRSTPWGAYKWPQSSQQVFLKNKSGFFCAFFFIMVFFCCGKVFFSAFFSSKCGFFS